MATGLRGLAQVLRAEPALIGGWRPWAGLVVAMVLVGLLVLRLGTVDGAAVRAALAQVAPLHWALALGLTVVSFVAVGRHDETLHRHLATGVAPATARRAGFAAIALSQMAGFGLVTGALVRWRMLPGMPLAQAVRLTLLVSLGFLAGWAVLAAAVIAALGPDDWRLAALGALGLAMAAMGASVLAPQRPGWPSFRTLARLVGLAAVDVLAAALALWVLMPAGLPLGLVLPAVVLAIGAGLVSGAPGGLGAFELTLLSLLPATPEAPLIAALLAWRMVYFALPALVAAALALRGPSAPARRAPALADPAPRLPPDPAFAEARLIRQAPLAPMGLGGLAFAGARLGQTLVLLRMPLAGAAAMGTSGSALAAIAATARAEGRGAALYKAPGRLAALARRAGWRVVPVAFEAVLDPAAFRLESPARAGLRRKLRRAADVGVLARAEPAEMAELAHLNDDWVAARGAELGFSMGRFDPAYLAGQRIYVARLGPRPVGFASFHTGAGEWALDLLRPHPAAPDGTAQALVTAALADAQRAGVARLSLAAVPLSAFDGARGPATWAGRRGPTGRAARGLWQFKSAFAPRWEPLYLLAPGWLTLALAALDIRRAIRHPPRAAGAAQAAAPHSAGAAPPVSPQTPATAPPPPEFGFASGQDAWHRKAG